MKDESTFTCYVRFLTTITTRKKKLYSTGSKTLNIIIKHVGVFLNLDKAL